MSRAVLTLCLLSAGCRWTFDDTAPDVTLLGQAPPLGGLRRYNQSPSGYEHVVLGADGAYWVAFTEALDTPAGRREGVRAVRLSPPEREEVILADEVEITWSAFFLLDRDEKDQTAPHVLTVRAAGQTTEPRRWTLPPGPGYLTVGRDDAAFLYWVQKEEETTYLLARSDGSFERRLPKPGAPLDPFEDQRMTWSEQSRFLLQRNTKTGELIARSTTSELDAPLGKRPPLYGAVGDELLTCGEDGLRAVRLDGGGERVLDPTVCDEHADLELDGDRLYYSTGSELRRVLLSGGAPETVLPGARRALAFSVDGSFVYSRDAGDRYVNGAGDGWIGGWRFMERGGDARFSADGKRVRWLEHAARRNGTGELISAELGKGPLHLALNTRRWEELEDGRLLANSNYAFRGEQNRLVVIDEKSRTARFIAEAVSSYSRIPDTNELLVDVIANATRFDIVRVPIPTP